MFEDVIINELCDGEGLLLSSVCFLCHAFQLLFDGTLNPPVETQRMNWMFHKERVISRGHFRRMHRMHPPAFDKLALLLDATLKSRLVIRRGHHDGCRRCEMRVPRGVKCTAGA